MRRMPVELHVAHIRVAGSSPAGSSLRARSSDGRAGTFHQSLSPRPIIMCHFINLILPAGTDVNSAVPALASLKRSPVRLSKPHLESGLLPREIVIHLSGVVCDCGTVIGSFHREAIDGQSSEVTREKLQKKGWSEAKIKRWQEQQDQTSVRKKRTHALRKAATPGSTSDEWCEVFSRLQNESHLPYVGLLLHWYDGGLESQVIRIKARTTLFLGGQLTEELRRIEDDVIYCIKPMPRHIYTAPSEHYTLSP